MAWVTPTSSKTGRRSYVLQRDFRVLEQEQRVTKILNSGAFRSELEGIIKSQVEGSRRPPRLSKSIQRLQDNAASGGHGQRTSSPQATSPVLPINDLRGVNASKYTLAERHLRCKLAAVYRLVDLFGWSQLIHNHITARATGEEEHFLVNPFGLLYEEVTASSLVRVDLEGNVISPGSTQLGVSQSGFSLHSAIHAARRHVKCVIHVHTTAGAAVSSMNCGLLPISQEALLLGGISYHDSRGVAGEQDNKKELARDLGPRNKVLILRNHGMVAMGNSIEEAFHYAFHLVRACEIQVAAMSAGLTNLSQSPGGVWGCGRHEAGRGEGRVGSQRTWHVGELEFEALMRMLDNKGYNTGYRYKGLSLLEPSPEYKRGGEGSPLAGNQPASPRLGHPKSAGTEAIHRPPTEQPKSGQNGQNMQKPLEARNIWDFLAEGEGDRDYPIFNQKHKKLQARAHEQGQSATSGQKDLWQFLDSPKSEEVLQPHLRYPAVPVNGLTAQPQLADRAGGSLVHSEDGMAQDLERLKLRQKEPNPEDHDRREQGETYPSPPRNLTPLELAEYTAERVAHFTGQAVKTLLSHRLQHGKAGALSPNAQTMDSFARALLPSEKEPTVIEHTHPRACHDSSSSSDDDRVIYGPQTPTFDATQPPEEFTDSNLEYSTSESALDSKEASPFRTQLVDLLHSPAVIQYREGCSPAEKAALTAQVVAGSTSVAVQKLSDSFTDRISHSSSVLSRPESP